VPVTVVANAPLRVPPVAGLTATVVVVPGSPDAADDWIAARAGSGDLVLTADVPLAARAIANGARCLDFRGDEFHPSGIGEALASRDLNAYLRAIGVTTSGPPAFSPRDRGRFASALDAAVSKLAREESARRSEEPVG
jgi:uncharacterized protein YaiI (UPF0178 family)